MTKTVLPVVLVLSAAAVCRTACARERILTLEAYRDRMQGGWVAQMAGVEWGTPRQVGGEDGVRGTRVLAGAGCAGLPDGSDRTAHDRQMNTGASHDLKLCETNGMEGVT